MNKFKTKVFEWIYPDSKSSKKAVTGARSTRSYKKDHLKLTFKFKTQLNRWLCINIKMHSTRTDRPKLWHNSKDSSKHSKMIWTRLQNKFQNTQMTLYNIRRPVTCKTEICTQTWWRETAFFLYLFLLVSNWNLIQHCDNSSAWAGRLLTMDRCDRVLPLTTLIIQND